MSGEANSPAAPCPRMGTVVLAVGHLLFRSIDPPFFEETLAGLPSVGPLAGLGPDVS